ncbi:MAG: peptidylprolyl isomerase [Verrucomicrobiales bacterium]
MRRPPLLFPIALFAAVSGPARADLDFTVEGRPYRLITNGQSFSNAEADAISKGGHLVHIDSQAENDAIFSAFSAAVPSGSTASDGGGSVYVWIGGTETAEGTYAWVDSTASPFWTGGTTGAAAEGAFANWGRDTVNSSGPEPDNFNDNQNRAAMAITAWPSSGSSKIGTAGQWNDIRDDNILAYVIEFDGLYASIVMSHGGVNKPPFTAKLHFDKAPMTVGNFIGLASGTKDFIHETAGAVTRRPYFNGITSHRIIDGFMIQTGCPRGTGTGGPGYTFLDEFNPALRHSKAGILSMANSGPHTNGSQFFITVAATPWLDDKHSVFGEVVSGYDETVLPLSKVPVTGSTPVQTVRIESMAIHRAGTAARAFNPAHADLPVVTRLVPPVVSLSGTHCILHYARNQHCAYELLQTGNLTAWALGNESLSVESFGPVPDAAQDTFDLVPANSDHRFFRVAEVQYPYPVYAPPTVSGKKITIADPNLATFIHNLTTATTGNYAIVNPALTGDIGNYFWERTPHGAKLTCYIGGTLRVGNTPVYYLSYTLRLTSATSGTARGAMQSINRSEITAVNGTVSLTDL